MNFTQKDGTVRVREHRCLYCGKPIDAIGATDGSDTKPQPGDFTLCLRCGAVHILADDLTVRGMTAAEQEKLMADTERMDEIARIVEGIRYMNANRQ